MNTCSNQSTDEQTKGYSLQTQLEACQCYAKERGYTVTETFADDYTGAVMDRPALNKLRDLIALETIETVIVYDVDRLARKSAYQVLIEEEFKRAGVLIEFVMGQYEDSDEGRLQKQIKGVIAEYEKAKILERSKRGKRGKAKSGFVLTGARPPYGYKVKSEPHKAWLVIDEDEAIIVRMVYNWYLNGDENNAPMSANAIAVRLTKMAIPTRGDTQAHFAKKHGQGVWQRAMIVHILTNETYTGIWYFGKTKMMDDDKQREPQAKRGLGKQVTRARDEWIPVEVPIIIDAEIFALAQERKEYIQRKLASNAEYEYLMKSRLTCAKCGYAMLGHLVNSRSRTKKHFYYLCNGKRQITKLCDMQAVRGDWVDALIWDWLKGIIENPDDLRAGLNSIQNELQQTNQILLNRLSIINDQIHEHQKQLDKLLDLYLNGDFPKEILTERKTRIESMLENLHKEQADLARHIRKVTLTDEQSAIIETFCAKIRHGLDQADFNTRRQIIELLDVRGKIARKWRESDISQMSDYTASALALSNIAFIKYWGNRDEHLRLPVNGSLSMNLDGLHARTTVRFDEGLEHDQLVINQREVTGPGLDRVSAILDEVRAAAGFRLRGEIRSENNFPTGAGIASSAAAFAALAVAATQAAGLGWSEAQLSKLARHGSGSACRSVPSGFVEWMMGTGDDDSVAVSIAGPEHWALTDCVAVISTGHKAIGSTEGHALAPSSPLQMARVLDAPRRLDICRNAILTRDFAAFGEMIELDSNIMHAVMMTSHPALFYWQPATLMVMNAVREWRAAGVPVAYTIDAGPNVHVLCPQDQAANIAAKLRELPGVLNVLTANVGSAAKQV